MEKDRNKKGIRDSGETLEKMGNGGIYDHLAEVPSVFLDQRWLIPHFEKMLI